MLIFFCWMQDISCFTVKSVLFVCTLEALSFHMTLMYAEYWTRVGFKTISDVTHYACWSYTFID